MQGLLSIRVFTVLVIDSSLKNAYLWRQMKFIAIIITATITLLAFKPGVDLLLLSHGNEQGCCVESCEAVPLSDGSDSDSEQKGNCGGNSCNPFQACCTGFILSFVTPSANEKNLEISTERNFSYQSILSTPFTSDFWHPPKTV